jgi:CBS domain-containing protein
MVEVSKSHGSQEGEMKVSELMTRDVKVVAPNDTVRRAAQIMDDLNVGALPVCDGQILVGMITDRDITIRATAAGKAPDQARVSDTMSTDVRWCFDDDDVDEVVRKMSDSQIRRVPVVSRDKKLVGIVALGDLATDQAPGVASALKNISEPSEPDR